MADLTADTIRELPAGPVLDALCAVAMGRMNGGYSDPNYLINVVEANRVSRNWEAAGPALQWLAKKWSLGLVDMNFGDTWHVVLHDGPDEQVISDASTPQLAIARAVARVGLRSRPDEMQAAWEELQP